MLAEKIKAAFRKTLCRTYELRMGDEAGRCETCSGPRECELMAEEALTYRQTMVGEKPKI